MSADFANLAWHGHGHLSHALVPKKHTIHAMHGTVAGTYGTRIQTGKFGVIFDRTVNIQVKERFSIFLVVINTNYMFYA